ncbi:MAG: hypothetical protein LLG37_10455 [Spirochaetia bacterium]|nr:hypothetical protein [Spirochaetia bacterium]
MRNMTAVILACTIILSAAGCATVNKNGLSGAEIKQLEKENQETFVKGLSAFCGLAIGALVGAGTSIESERVGGMATGGVIGGLLGFGLGLVVVEVMGGMEEKPSDKKAEEYFRDYKNIQGKD